MEIRVEIDKNGARTDHVTLTDEENKAVDEAHKIVAERCKELGLTQSTWETEHLEYYLLGLLRFEGMDSMLHHARTAKILEKRK